MITEERLTQIEADPPCATFGEMRKLISMARTNSNLVRVLEWFADAGNWREEELSEGYRFSAEWKMGFSPIEMARSALIKAGRRQ